MPTPGVEPQVVEDNTLTPEEIAALDRRVRPGRELEPGEITVSDPEICM